jgi:hypothetical protein
VSVASSSPRRSPTDSVAHTSSSKRSGTRASASPSGKPASSARRTSASSPPSGLASCTLASRLSAAGTPSPSPRSASSSRSTATTAGAVVRAGVSSGSVGSRRTIVTRSPCRRSASITCTSDSPPSAPCLGSPAAVSACQ